MRIVIAPDSYKGSLSALRVASAIEAGVLRVFPDAEIVKIPIADGGEGFVEALALATGGTLFTEEVPGPLGRPVRSTWGALGDGRSAVIEMAAASGMSLISPQERDPRITTTLGTGRLIKAALDRGFCRIILGIGGSATNDGGAGMAQALGVSFLDSDGKELSPGGAALANLSEVRTAGLDPRLKETELIVACDVDNPLIGPRGASLVYGPQKGATPEVAAQLDNALKRFGEIAFQGTGKDIASRPGAGAAGGLGAGLMFFTDAEFRPGVDVVLNVTGFDSLVQTADLVITGEGATDFQTAFGKAPMGVAARAKRHGKPVVCLSGGLLDGSEEVLRHGMDAIFSIPPRPMSLQECMENAPMLIEEAAERLARLLKVGVGLKNAD